MTGFASPAYTDCTSLVTIWCCCKYKKALPFAAQALRGLLSSMRW